MLANYVSPLVSRYASHEMAELFSPLSYARAWRRVWLALAEAEAECGAPISDDQLKAMRDTLETIDLARVAQIEAQTRHDVMAHLQAWGEICPTAKPIIHLGATSQFVNDNAEALIIRQASLTLRNRLVNVIRALASFAQREASTPTLGYSHFQPAQLVTVGKRACMWTDDLLMDLQDLAQRLEEMPCRGAKGTVGTQASYLDLLGSVKAVRELDQRVAIRLGFARPANVTGQSLSRKWDLRFLDVLANISVSLGKMGRDLRLLMHTGDLREPFKKTQVGSSAMPYKRNPILAERLCALARVVTHQRNTIAEMAATQWLERSLDDSATRRIALPEAYLATDGQLRIAYELAAGIRVDAKRREENIEKHLPFLAVEKILAEVVKNGGDRQAAHEQLRVHAMTCYDDASQDFIDLVVTDPMFKFLKRRMKNIVKAENLVGAAPQQVDYFLKETVRPVMQRYSDIPAMLDTMSV